MPAKHEVKMLQLELEVVPHISAQSTHRMPPTDLNSGFD